MNSKKKTATIGNFQGCQYWQISSLAFDIDNNAQCHTCIVLYILVCDISDCGIDSNFGSNGKYLIVNCGNLNRAVFKAAKTDNFQGCSSKPGYFQGCQTGAAKPGKFQN